MLKFLNNFRFLLVLSLFALPFTSCSSDDDSDDDNNNNNSSSIVGNWNVTRIITANCDDPSDDSDLNLADEPCIEFFGIEVCTEIEMTFTSGGDLSFTSMVTTTGYGTETDTEEGTYSVDGNNITICDEDGDCDTGTYSISGNTLNLSYSDPSDGCDSDITANKK